MQPLWPSRICFPVAGERVHCAARPPWPAAGDSVLLGTGRNELVMRLTLAVLRDLLDAAGPLRPDSSAFPVMGRCMWRGLALGA